MIAADYYFLFKKICAEVLSFEKHIVQLRYWTRIKLIGGGMKLDDFIVHVRILFDQ